MKRNVVVTGIGAVSPLGLDFMSSWDAIKKGACGIRSVERLKSSGIKWRHCGTITGFDPAPYMPKKYIKRLDRFVHLATAAAAMAIDDAGIKRDGLRDAAVVVGSSRGGLGAVEESMKRRRPSAFAMSASTISMAASFITMMHRIEGRIIGISNACASGSAAIGEAMRLIRDGHADIAIAGGAEAPLSEFCVSAYGSSGALSKTGISRPFDRRRDGFILSEGAAVLVLESEDSAIRRRAAKAYGIICGYGNACDAFHETMPHINGQIRAVDAALSDAGLRAGDMDLISAHATSTKAGDKVEASLIESAFNGNKPHVFCAKSSTGHMLAASGALEAAFALLCLSEGVVPPSINSSDIEFNVNVSDALRKSEMKHAIADSFGFGGVNSVLAISKI